jgi:4-diphosphocytidyl-2-C-methyl-D-erythritol kinase
MITLFSPAKINLFLVVLGKRSDGYHSIWSLAAFLRWGDTIDVKEAKDKDILECSDPAVPTDGRNSILRALAEFRRRHPCPPLRIKLKKKIPIGSGFGGGTSNGVTFLKGLNRCFKCPLSEKVLRQVALKLGSDGPLFLGKQYIPVWASGRGEKTSLSYDLGLQARDNRVFVIVPPFRVDTVMAYAELTPYEYEKSRKMMIKIKASLRRWDVPMFNSFEKDMFLWQPWCLKMKRDLKEIYDFDIHLTGSGSGFYGFPAPSLSIRIVRDFLWDFWKSRIPVIETRTW